MQTLRSTLSPTARLLSSLWVSSTVSTCRSVRRSCYLQCLESVFCEFSVRYVTIQLLTTQSTCFVSVLRLVYIYPMAVNPDQTWHSPLLCIWSAVELNVAIICSCAPTLRCLFQRFWPKLLNSMASGYGSAKRSNRDDSAATAVNSDSNMSSAQRSYYKPGNISQIEAGRASKQPVSRLQAFRRSFTNPFGDKNHRPENYYELDNKADARLHHGSSLADGKSSLQMGRDIEVEVSVEQTSDANSTDFSKPSEWRPC